MENNIGKLHRSPAAKSLRTGLFAAILSVIALLLLACQPLQMPEAAPEAEAAATPAVEEEASTLPAGSAEAGGYIFSITGGCGCHFNRDLQALAGGNVFEGAYGVVPAPNITPDEATGIGAWSDQQFADSMRVGIGGDGRQLFPIMPYHNYSVLSDQDVVDLAAFLRARDPVENAVALPELASEVPAFAPATAPPAEAPTEAVARGEYLVSLARCSRCHTPSLEDGSADMSLYLAGAPLRDQVAPNITPDDDTGIGLWTEDEIAHLLQTGEYSDGSLAEGAMESQVSRGLNQLTDDDALAIAAYLTSLEPISNLPLSE